MSEDFSDNSLLLIEGVECQGFFSYLLNAKSTISSVGRLAGVPPTLLASVAFPKATMQHLVPRSKKVRLDGVDYYSIDIKGLLLPTFLPSVATLLCETRQMFSATLASSINTLSFSKATQKLLESSPEELKAPREEDAGSGQVFGEQNLSECGLLPSVVGSICRTGQHAVGLLERVCYQRGEGYAWSWFDLKFLVIFKNADWGVYCNFECIFVKSNKCLIAILVYSSVFLYLPRLVIHHYKLVYAPVFVRVVGQKTANNNWNLLLLQLFHRYLQWIRLAIQFNHNRRAHGNLQCSRAQDACAFVFRHIFCSDTFGFGHTTYSSDTRCNDLNVVNFLLLGNVLVNVVINIVEIITAADTGKW